MKKTILSLILAVVMAFGASQGAISALAVTKQDEDTPVAKIDNDNYVPYDYKRETKYDDKDVIADLTKQVESVGGYVETYSSEEEYLNTQKVSSAEMVDYSYDTENIKQIITVMTTATGSKANGNYVESKPVQNAIVRINGVPRYTNRSGQIQATLQKGSYVELFVEKAEYNPYIEIMEVTGGEKIIRIKQPSDDVEIYAVMFDYFGMSFNLLTQNCYYNKDYFNKYCDLTVLSNVAADEYYILVNGERKFYSSTGIFYNLKLDNYSRNDKFSVQIIYDGVSSKENAILLTLVDSFIDLNLDKVDDGTLSQNIGDDTFSDLGTANLDFNSILQKTIITYLNKEEVEVGNPFEDLFDKNFSLKLGCVYDPTTGEMQYSIGFTISFTLINEEVDLYKKSYNKTKELEAQNADKREEIEKLEEQIADKEQQKAELEKKYEKSEINKENYLKRKEALLEEKQSLKSQLESNKSSSEYIKNQQEISKINKNISDNLRYYEKRQKDLNEKISNLAQDINNNKKSMSDALNSIKSIPEIIRGIPNLTNIFSISYEEKVNLDIELLGTIYYSCLSEQFTKVTIAIGATVKLSFTFKFVVWIVPCFVTVEFTGGLRIQVTFDLTRPLSFKEFLRQIELIFIFGLKLDVGVGGNLASVSVFGSIELEMGVSFGNMFDGKQCFRITINWEYGFRAHFLFWDYKISHYESENILDYERYKLMSRSNFALNNPISNNQIALNIFQNSSLKLIKLNDNEELLIWLEDTPEKDDYNRTTLKSAFISDGNIIHTSSINEDSNPYLAFDVLRNDNGIFLLCQKTTRNIIENDTPQTILKDSQLEVVRLNEKTGEFDWVKQIPFSSNSINQKFAVSDDNNLAVTWIENSNSDAFGLSGTNNIKYSKYKNGEWTIPQNLITTEKAIYDFTSAYNDNDVLVAMTVDDDGDFLTMNSNLVMVKNDSIKQIADGGNIKSQFCYVDGELNLYYINNGYLYRANGAFQNSAIETLLDANDFHIEQCDGKLIITYEKYIGDYKQVMCSYNINGNWTHGVQLTEENYSCSDSNGYLCDDKISFVYKITDEQGNASLCYDSVEFVAAIKVEDIIFDGFIEDGIERELTLKISNLGNVDISEFNVYCFGQIININLVESLKVSEYGYYDIIVIPCVTDESMIKIRVEGSGDFGKMAVDEYLLNVDFVDLSLDLSWSVLSNGSQNIKLKLLNYSKIQSEFSINVYINGEFYSVIAVDNIGGNEEWEKNLIIENANINDYICFEVVTNKEDKYLINNYLGLYITSVAEIEHAYNNCYNGTLNVAKGLL